MLARWLEYHTTHLLNDPAKYEGDKIEENLESMLDFVKVCLSSMTNTLWSFMHYV